MKSDVSFIRTYRFYAAVTMKQFKKCIFGVVVFFVGNNYLCM